jgi:AraC-like DNA-binding protein
MLSPLDALPLGGRLDVIPLGGRAAVFPRRSLPLHVMPAGYGRQRVESETYRWHGLQRGPSEFVIWQYTVSGQGALAYEGTEHAVGPGEAMLLVVPHDHVYFLPPGGGHWEFFYLNLVGSEALRICRELLRRNGPVGHFAPGSATVALAIGLCAGMARGSLDSPLRASAQAYRWLMRLAEDRLPAGGDGAGGGASSWMEAVVRLCQERLEDALTVDDLAAAAGYSRFHFTRQFTRLQGIPPGEFLRQLRLRHAVRLLQTERLGIKEIAARTGFRDASYFGKVFRREFGVSPDRYRRGG